MNPPSSESTQQLVDHLFRHEAGKMIAVLTRIFGISNLELVEDTVQETFLKALQVWKYRQVPDNPSAWLMQVARNHTIDLIRKQQRQAGLSAEVSKDWGVVPRIPFSTSFWIRRSQTASCG